MAKVIGTILGAIIGYGIAFFINAGIVWVLVWGLKTIGITTIAGWTVRFSWPLVILFMLTFMILKAIFGQRKKER